MRGTACLTDRARREACRLVSEDGLDVATVATMLGVSWHTAMRAVRDFGRPLIDDPTRTAGVEAVGVGVDETAFLAANAGSHTQFVTGTVAMPGPGQAGPRRKRAQLLGIVPGRTGSVVWSWIPAHGLAWRAEVTTASLNPFWGYATALRTSLPGGVRVRDAFHVVRLGQAAVDDVRRRRQQETLGRRGHREGPLYPAGGCYATLNQRQWSRLGLTLTVGDPSAADRSLHGRQGAPAALRPQPRPRGRTPAAVADLGPLRPVRRAWAAPPRSPPGRLVPEAAWPTGRPLAAAG